MNTKKTILALCTLLLVAGVSGCIKSEEPEETWEGTAVEVTVEVEDEPTKECDITRYGFDEIDPTNHSRVVKHSVELEDTFFEKENATIHSFSGSREDDSAYIKIKFRNETIENIWFSGYSFKYRGADLTHGCNYGVNWCVAGQRVIVERPVWKRIIKKYYANFEECILDEEFIGYEYEAGYWEIVEVF